MRTIEQLNDTTLEAINTVMRDDVHMDGARVHLDGNAMISAIGRIVRLNHNVKRALVNAEHKIGREINGWTPMR